jgi:arginyl-tRNA synthetase
MAQTQTINHVWLLVKDTISKLFPELQINEKEIKKISLPDKKNTDADVSFSCHNLAHAVSQPSHDVAKIVCACIAEQLPTSLIATVEFENSYVNFFMRLDYLTECVYQILQKDSTYLAPRPSTGKSYMIEYSGLNTHKVFHVGHMRNTSLGEALVNITEFMGTKVYATNYIGDVGTHVAQCLWYYLYFIQQTDLETFENKSIDEQTLIKQLESDKPKGIAHVEWLGELYQKGHENLDLSLLTSMPFPGYLATKVVQIADHPTNGSLKVVTLSVGNDTDYQVVCGGTSYSVDDVVVYAPVGAKMAGRKIVAQDISGVTSYGFICSEHELSKGKNKNKIYLLDASVKPGTEVTEVGRYEGIPVSADVNIAHLMAQRHAQVKQLTLSMEHSKPNITLLWKITRTWSLDDLDKMYKWIGCRFDHYYYKSEVGEESKELVMKAYQDGILKLSDGAIGADLARYNLGFCILLTSAGTGIYATKDLQLAKVKFEQYKLDRSILVVDESQTLHFKQVFKTLELLGIDNEEISHHLAYGLVVVKDKASKAGWSKMGSRKGNVKYFSLLKNEMTTCLLKAYQKRFEIYAQQKEKLFQKQALNGEISKGELKKPLVLEPQELETVIHRLAIAAIKYGMLNQDNKSQIIFDIEDWTNIKGNTGPYIMYAYTRTQSMLRQVVINDYEEMDLSLLSTTNERKLLSLLSSFSHVVEHAADQFKPQLVCAYVYDLARSFSKMYDTEGWSVKYASSPALQVARIALIDATGQVMKKALELIGIVTVSRM